jgi:hypothetical protein
MTALEFARTLIGMPTRPRIEAVGRWLAAQPVDDGRDPALVYLGAMFDLADALAVLVEMPSMMEPAVVDGGGPPDGWF